MAGPQRETIYIPKPKTSHHRWGTRSRTRKLIDERNASIKGEFKYGRTINQIADEYHLSIETIKKLSTLNKKEALMK
ncbi:hypothetical protein AAHB47_29420 [Bacillus wiedmannii]